MYSNSSFALSNSYIKDVVVTEDTIVLKCLYMRRESVQAVFENVTNIKNYASLKGNTINYINTTAEGFDIYYTDESIEPTCIKAAGHRIEWK